MYNEDFKRNYLRQIENAALYEQQFNTFERFEELYGKDVYDFTVSQILTVYKSIGTTSIYFLYHINNRNERYADYALNQNVVKDGQNHFSEIKMPVLMSCLDNAGIKSSVISKNDLRVYIGRLLNPLDKYLMWACFEGLDGDDHSEITRLKLSDIDEKTKTAKLISGRIIHVSDELILEAKESKNTYYYNKYLVKESKTNTTNTLTGDDIWKVSIRKDLVDSDRARGIQAYRILNRCIDYLGLPKGYISIHNLRQSGIIDYVQTLAKENKISCYDVLYTNKDTFDLVSNQYQLTASQRTTLYRKYNDFFNGNGIE